MSKSRRKAGRPVEEASVHEAARLCAELDDEECGAAADERWQAILSENGWRELTDEEAEEFHAREADELRRHDERRERLAFLREAVRRAVRIGPRRPARMIARPRAARQRRARRVLRRTSSRAGLDSDSSLADRRAGAPSS